MKQKTIIIVVLVIMTLITIGSFVLARPVTDQKAFITMLLSANLKDDKAVNEQLSQVETMGRQTLIDIVEHHTPRQH